MGRTVALPSREKVAASLGARCQRALRAFLELDQMCADLRGQYQFVPHVDATSWMVSYSVHPTDPAPPAVSIVADEVVHHCRVVVETANVYLTQWKRQHPGQSPPWARIDTDVGLQWQIRRIDNYSKHQSIPVIAAGPTANEMMVAAERGQVVLGHVMASAVTPVADDGVFAVTPELPAAWRHDDIVMVLAAQVEMVFGHGIDTTVDGAPVISVLGDAVQAAADLASAVHPTAFPT